MKSYENHVPVMLNEVLKYMNPIDNEVYVDCTFGAGGYTGPERRRKKFGVAHCRGEARLFARGLRGALPHHDLAVPGEQDRHVRSVGRGGFCRQGGDRLPSGEGRDRLFRERRSARRPNPQAREVQLFSLFLLALKLLIPGAHRREGARSIAKTPQRRKPKFKFP